MTFNKKNKTAHLDYLLRKEIEKRKRAEAFIQELIDDKRQLLQLVEHLKNKKP